MEWLKVEKEKALPVIYKDIKLDHGYRIDLLIENKLVIEIKTVEKLLSVHQAQLMTYMKILKKPQGLLINFYTDNITKSMIPLVNEYFSKLPE